MTLSKRRQEELSLIILASRVEKEGIMLNPKEIKREICNTANNLDLPISDVAEFQKTALTMMFEKTLKEIDKLIIPTGKVE
jgi:hypothetical protein